MTQKPVSPDTALKRFLAVVGEEADMNVAFRNRLLLAIGVPVLFEGADDLSSISPTEVARRYEEAAFKRIYSTLKPAQLKSILVSSNLASKSDVSKKGMKGSDFIDLLWSRTLERLDESAPVSD